MSLARYGIRPERLGCKSMNEKKFNQTAYIREYNEKTYDRIELKIPKGKKAEWKAKAKAEGLSLTEWITKQIEEK